VRLLTLAVVLVLAVAAAGCGGDDDESSGDGDTVTLETTTDETTTDETTTDETTTDETTDETIGDSLASEDCQELISASAALGTAFSGVQGEDLDESTEAFDRYADSAPEEIRADLQIMADTYREYIEAIQDIGLDAGETPSPEQAAEFQQALTSIDTTEFSAASQRFTTWAAANC
jgi:hypothetical protein